MSDQRPRQIDGTLPLDANPQEQRQELRIGKRCSSLRQ